MDELEQRLRAAMTAVTEPPPPGLLAAVRRRQRRGLQLRWAGASCAAAATAVAVTVLALTSAQGPAAAGGGRGSGIGSVPGQAGQSAGSAHSTPPQLAQRGTALRDCATARHGLTSSWPNRTLPANWKSLSVRVGPVWLVYARIKGAWPATRQLSDGYVPHETAGRLRPGASGDIIAVRDGITAVVSAAPAQRRHLRFQVPGPGGPRRFTPRDGWSGLTLAACPAGPHGTGMPASYAAGLTLYWIAYLTDLSRCLPLDVRQLPAGRPVPVALSTRGGTCRAG